LGIVVKLLCEENSRNKQKLEDVIGVDGIAFITTQKENISKDDFLRHFDKEITQ
jgi:hypothetical protein